MQNKRILFSIQFFQIFLSSHIISIILYSTPHFFYLPKFPYSFPFTDSTRNSKRKQQHIIESNKNIHEPQNLCIITTQIDTVDKLNMWITIENNIWHNIGLTLKAPYWSRQAIITASSYDLEDHKNNGVATNLFCTGVIGHPGCMFLS